jgi:hypothetical protein
LAAPAELLSFTELLLLPDMTLDQFTASLEETMPPAGLPPVLQALWYDANDDWEHAHEVAQSQEGEPAFDRLHAYLHRKEGDLPNAEYWYRQATEPIFDGSLYDEWQSLVNRYTV